MVVTGVLDNFINVSVGDNIYDKLNNAEMIVEDGLVKEIRPASPVASQPTKS